MKRILTLLVFATLFTFPSKAVEIVHGYSLDKTEICKNNPVHDQMKSLFITSFSHQYRDIPLKQIKPHFKNRQDIKKWLAGAFDEECSYIDDKASGKNKAVWLVKEKNKLIGFFVTELIELNNKTYLHHRQIAVDTAYQRKGIGSAVLDYTKDIEKEAKGIAIHVRQKNKRAIAFYERNGFKKIKSFMEDYDNPYYTGMIRDDN